MFFNYPPSSGIASCVRTVGTVMWCLHLTRPCYSALGRVLICGFFSIGLSSLPIRARCFPKRREKAGLLLSILIKFVHINTRPQAGFDRPFGECKIYWMKKWRSKNPCRPDAEFHLLNKSQWINLILVPVDIALQLATLLYVIDRKSGKNIWWAQKCDQNASWPKLNHKKQTMSWRQFTHSFKGRC